LAVVAGALLMVAVVFPPRTSHDLWSYAMYGRITAAHHASPYVASPASFPHDPALERVDPAWRHTRSVYGPMFTGASAVITRVTNRPLPTRVVYQAWAALAVGAVVIALARRGRSAAVAAVGLHPLVVVQLVNAGHNDAFIGVLLLGAAVAARRRQPGWVGIALALAVGTKAVAILPAVALLAWVWRAHGRRVAAWAGTTMAVIVALAYGAAGGATALRPLAGAASFVSRASIWRLLDVSGSRGLARIGLMIGLVIIPAMVLSTARLRISAEAAAAAAVLVYLLAAPYVLPWYFAWAIPLVALADDMVIAAVVFTQSLLVMLAYSPPYGRVLHPDRLDEVMHAIPRVAAMAAFGALLALVGAALVWVVRGHRARLAGSSEWTSSKPSTRPVRCAGSPTNRSPTT
jgi:alpha-1,6-mannosyltransferase